MQRWRAMLMISIAAFASVLFSARAIFSLEAMHHMDAACFAECVDTASPDASVAVAAVAVALAVAVAFVMHVAARADIRFAEAAVIVVRKGILRLQRRD